MRNIADASSIAVALGLGGTISVGPQRIAVAEVTTMLGAIATTGTLGGVAETLGLSYRAAWERLKECEAAFGKPLVRKTRGHGSALTDAGRAVHDALSRAQASLDEPLARESRALRHLIDAALSEATPDLAFAVSHDLLLTDALGRCGYPHAAVVGSGEAIGRLVAGRVDVAGFHCGPMALDQAGPPFVELAQNSAFVVRPLFMREQGLLLASGNPLRIQTLKDLADRRARYVNRQAGSGTRIWFDHMLADAGLGPADIAGYELEEFTHHAVAAVIASGAADAGLAARSAAERFGLEFLHSGWETYYIATAATLAAEALESLIAEVEGLVSRTTGYRPAP
jgi:molybdate transport repressor ModE-like protein